MSFTRSSSVVLSLNRRSRKTTRSARRRQATGTRTLTEIAPTEKNLTKIESVDRTRRAFQLQVLDLHGQRAIDRKIARRVFGRPS